MAERCHLSGLIGDLLPRQLTHFEEFLARIGRVPRENAEMLLKLASTDKENKKRLASHHELRVDAEGYSGFHPQARAAGAKIMSIGLKQNFETAIQITHPKDRMRFQHREGFQAVICTVCDAANWRDRDGNN